MSPTNMLLKIVSLNCINFFLFLLALAAKATKREREREKERVTTKFLI